MANEKSRGVSEGPWYTTQTPTQKAGGIVEVNSPNSSSWSTPTRGTVVVLAGCSNEKSDKPGDNGVVPGAAEVVYRSRLFHMARMFAERLGDAWYILSGKYGVLSPSSPIERYDYDLTKQDALTQTQWAMHAADQLCVRLESDQVASGVVHLVIVCGATYAAIADYLPSSDPRWQFVVHQPLDGLPVGKRFAWLRKQVQVDDSVTNCDQHSIRLNDNQLGMLRRFDNNLEQHLYQFGARRQCSMALWKKGLVVQVQDHPTNEGWTLFDITDKGRRLMTKIKRSEERRAMPDTVSVFGRGYAIVSGGSAASARSNNSVAIVREGSTTPCSA